MKKILAITAACLVSAANILPVYAADFKDVAKSHWAYDSIMELTAAGYISGDLSGNFNPDGYIDKFDTAKFLARLNGYKITDATEADKALYQRIYEKHKNILSSYEKKFTKWNPTAENEIAFLLENNIFKEEDLEQFVIKNSAGKEQLRALSREELAVFLVRTMGKTADANSLEITEKFDDDASISQNKKNAVYYLRSIDVVKGGTDNKFKPKSAVTKAALCLMADNCLSLMGVTDVSSRYKNVNNIENITGTIEKVYADIYGVQIKTADGEKMFRIQDTAEIKIDSYIKPISDLKPGYSVTAVLNNSEIISLEAKTTAIGIKSADGTEKEKTISDNTSSDNTSQNKKTPEAENKDKNLPENFSKLSYDENLTAETLKGDITEILYDNKKESYALIIKATGKSHKVSVSEKSLLSRNGLYGIGADELRIGDSFTAEIKNGVVITLDSKGEVNTFKSYVIGTDMINGRSRLILCDDLTDDSEREVYYADTRTVDMGSFSVGDRVSVTTDSSEIISVYVRKKANSNSVTGNISQIDKGIVKLDSYEEKITFDVNTVILDSRTGEYIKSSQLEKDMKVYVVFGKKGDPYAKYITITEVKEKEEE
ncbi:MAG: S-layer homology domain-containing protein [Firmicutes bacterium]|nr:S-layer homology domain-containing protein [Bacillota bacterium]